MKNRRLFLSLFLLAAMVSPLAAQPKPTPESLAIGAARVASINTEGFVNENNGIKKLVKVLQQLDEEFKAQETELMAMSNHLTALGQEVGQLRANPAADPKVTSSKMAELQQLQRSFKQKGEAAQAVYNKRNKELRQPVEAEIAKELTNYAQDRNFAMILDSSRLGGPVLAARPNLDVTGDFIAYFNAKHPQ
jgi:Skp family chaperone for outer membrane proteins